MPTYRYTRQCYIMLKDLDESGWRTLATIGKNNSFENAFRYIWLSKNIGDSNIFLSNFKERIKDCALQKILTNIGLSTKAEFNRHYKTLLNTERYLSINSSHLKKRRLSNGRCSQYKLMIEKGRHLNINREFKYFRSCEI